MSRTNIIILATYWNEREWIEASLEQIDKIDPVEIIICDGCFDPSVENRSTDGTREIIERFVAERSHAKMVSARRPNTMRGTLSALRGHPTQSTRLLLKPDRWRSTFRALQVAAYRRNQAITFQQMIGLSDNWDPGRWFMTYDADQFYSDEMIDAFEITKKDTNIDLLTGNELTFFTSFGKCTTDYESRTYNNMPHRIRPETTIRPTRDIILERGCLQTLLTKSPYYIDNVEIKNVGRYFHYKIPSVNPKRFNKGYILGDRNRPDIAKYNFNPYKKSHPSIIEDHFEQKIKNTN